MTRRPTQMRITAKEKLAVCSESEIQRKTVYMVFFKLYQEQNFIIYPTLIYIEPLYLFKNIYFMVETCYHVDFGKKD